MPLKELREKHGGTKSRETINRAIRAECPGGDIALDRLRDWHHICERRGWGQPDQPEALHVTAYRHWLELVDAMEDVIRERYGMPPRPQREDLRR